MTWLIRILLFALALYLIALVAIYVFQRKLLYFPPQFYNAPPEWMEEVRAENGSLFWWSPPARDTAPVVMIFHGNASSIDSLGYVFNTLREKGYGVASVGYPGYPGNEDRPPSQTALVEAATTQYDKLISLGMSSDRIVFYGTSLGSGVASQLAAQREPALLILDAPFQSTLSIAQANMKFMPVSLLMKDTYRSDLALAELDIPLIWIHGEKDRVIPVESGQALFDGYPGPKSGHVLAHAQHHDSWFQGGREIVLNALSDLETPEPKQAN